MWFLTFNDCVLVLEQHVQEADGVYLAKDRVR